MILTSISIFCEGGHFVLLPSHCAKSYDSNEQGVQVYSLLVSCFGLSSISGSLFISIMLNNFDKKTAFEYIFGFATLLNIFGFLSLLSYNKFIKQLDFIKIY